jgi:hypothetical protein
MEYGTPILEVMGHAGTDPKYLKEWCSLPLEIGDPFQYTKSKMDTY